LLTVCAPTAAEAERWLSDLRALTDAPVALYPQREGLGEQEPHYEIAGERVETLEALLSSRLRVLVTTARATAERTLVPSGLASLRVVLRAGEQRPLKEVIESLDAMGYKRVPTVTEVAEFSVRGGIIDVYGFGMADAARAEWWGDELNSLWTFDLTSQRSQSQIDEVTILPISVPDPPRSRGLSPPDRVFTARPCWTCCPATPSSSRKPPVRTAMKWSGPGGRQSTISRLPAGWGGRSPAGRHPRSSGGVAEATGQLRTTAIG
jgi:hypothetical protein